MAKCPRQQNSFPQVYFSIDNVGFRGHQERFKKRFFKIRLRSRHSNDLHLPNKENRYETIQKASGVFTIYLPTIQLGNFKSRLKKDGGKEQVSCVKGDRGQGRGGGGIKKVWVVVCHRGPDPVFDCLFSDAYSFSLEMKLSGSHCQPLKKASSRKRNTQ